MKEFLHKNVSPHGENQKTRTIHQRILMFTGIFCKQPSQARNEDQKIISPNLSLMLRSIRSFGGVELASKFPPSSSGKCKV